MPRVDLGAAFAPSKRCTSTGDSFALQLQGRDRFEIKEPLRQPVSCGSDKNFTDR